MDEHRLDLKPIVGRVWAERGKAPTVPVQHRSQWLCLYAFACPQTGEKQCWPLPSVNTEAFQAVLERFAGSTGAGKTREIILVRDGARWHTTPLLHCPDGVAYVFLPPYSPELHPAERLWQLTDAPLKNRHFETLAHLQETLAAPCRWLEGQRSRVRALNRPLSGHGSCGRPTAKAFSNSVPHDLRTPVRHVKGFSELARKALDRGDTQQALEHMLVVEKAALRMNTLIDAMLDLSRTSQQELRIGAVDLDALVHRAMQDVEQDRLEGRVTWNVAPLPTVQGDQGSLQQVINNLLANAVKYSRTRPEAVIDVWAEETPGHQTLHVRNNGVGFSPVYRDRLFRVFQRLHTDREFEGTGVGLAIVQWIILRHRGSVFADGVPDQGATFGFSLPNLPRD